jgi:hypothetical protein
LLAQQGSGERTYWGKALLNRLRRRRERDLGNRSVTGQQIDRRDAAG